MWLYSEDFWSREQAEYEKIKHLSYSIGWDFKVTHKFICMLWIKKMELKIQDYYSRDDFQRPAVYFD